MKLGSIVFILLLTLSGVFVLSNEKVHAKCESVSEYGSLDYNLPIAPSQSKQAKLWLRIQSDINRANLLAEVNSSECINLKSDVVPDQWSWISSEDLIKLDRDNNSVKIVGTQAGVKIDKVLIITDDCTPVEDGGNCISKSNYVDEAGLKFIELVSPKGTLTGKVRLSDTPDNNISNLSKVSYLVSGRQLQSSEKPILFNTSLVENGSHRVYIITELDNGDVVREVVSINVSNSEGPFSPIIRFMKLNRVILGLILLVSASLLIVTLVILFIRNRRRSRTAKKLKGLDI